MEKQALIYEPNRVNKFFCPVMAVLTVLFLAVLIGLLEEGELPGSPATCSSCWV